VAAPEVDHRSFVTATWALPFVTGVVAAGFVAFAAWGGNTALRPWIVIAGLVVLALVANVRWRGLLSGTLVGVAGGFGALITAIIVSVGAAAIEKSMGLAALAAGPVKGSSGRVGASGQFTGALHSPISLLWSFLGSSLTVALIVLSGQHRWLFLVPPAVGVLLILVPRGSVRRMGLGLMATSAVGPGLWLASLVMGW